MILDKGFHEILLPDEGNQGSFMVFDEPEADVSPHFPLADTFRYSSI